MVLSILICSLHERREYLSRLLNVLKPQLTPEVEVKLCIDNKEATTGHKRNELLKAAKGKYIIFIDDDDQVPDYYISELLIAAKSDADCFAINGIITTDGKNEIKWYLSKNNPNVTTVEKGVTHYLRTTNHITAVKRELALKAGFPNKSNAEDKAYSSALIPYLKTEHIISKPMYHYQYVTKNKSYK